MFSAKDIQNMQFTEVEPGKYDAAEVDDFLDALSQQVSAMFIKEQALSKAAQDARDDVDLVREELDEANRKLTAVAEDDTPKDSEYFENLKKVIREAMISAQRISEETVAHANDEAARIVSDAQEKATHLTDDAQAEADRITAATEVMKQSLESYREQLRKLIAVQTEALNQ